MNDATLKEVRQLKDSNNQYLWQPSLQLGNPAQLLGSPVATDPNIETIATAKKVMAFGDMSKYFIREAGGFNWIEALTLRLQQICHFQSDLSSRWRPFGHKCC